MLTSRPLPPVTAAPIGPASGDLGGTYPAPTVTSGANHTHAASQIASGTLAVSRGGTGGTTDAEARTSLGAAAASHTHGAADIASGTLAVARGGTGSANAADARAALGIDDSPRMIPLFDYATTEDEVVDVKGGVGFTPSDYAVPGRSTVLTLDAIGRVSRAGLTGTLELLDESNAVVATRYWTETDRTRKTLIFTTPMSDVIWRPRVSCTGVVDPITDYAIISGAHVRITRS